MQAPKIIRTLPIKKLLALLSLYIINPIALADYKLNLMPGVTEISNSIYRLHNIILWICVAIGIGVFGVMFYAVFKHRKSKGAKAAQFHDSTFVEIVWTTIPFLILVAMAIPATTTLIKMHDTSAAAVDIKVTGYQWKWKYDYINEDFGFFSELAESSQQASVGKRDFPENYLLEVDNPLVVPINQKVRFLITANDVLHAWWVPDFGVKKDAIPGFINESWTKVDKPGVYRGQCAELCGKGHGFMPIVVVAKPEAEYAQWVKQQKVKFSQVVDLADKSKDWLMEKGLAVYNKKCSACHMPNGMGMPGAFPAIQGSAIATGPVGKHMEIVLNGKAGTAMQAFSEQLNAVELAAVMTYQRNAWGNQASIVQPKQVHEYQAQ